MALAHRKTASVGFAAGLLAMYLGERVLGSGHVGLAATLLGLLATLAALALALRSGKGQDGGMILPGVYGLGLFALLLYFSRATLPGLFGHRALAATLPRLDGVLAALWPGLLATSVLCGLLVELSYASMARAPVVDARRLGRALRAGLGISFALVFCCAIGYVAAERNLKADLSFFRTARASAATRQIVAALDQPVVVTLFYPPGNEVAEELDRYFADLVHPGGKLSLSRVDQAVDPARGKALGVSANGAVAIARGSQHEQLQIPLKLESARGRLRSLDQDVYKRILMVSRGKRTVYLVQGHGERSFAVARDGDPGAALSHLKELLGIQNLEARDLSLAQGLGNEVPPDAALVMVIGPQAAMLPEETAALLRYFHEGGRLLVAIDPDGADTAAPLLGGLALELSPTVLANDRVYWARTHQKSDRTAIAATSFSSHAALPTLSQFGAQLPVVFLGAGSLSKTKIAPSPAPTVDLVVRTDANTFADHNGDFELAPGEQRKAYTVAAAVTLRQAGDAAKPTAASATKPTAPAGSLSEAKADEKPPVSSTHAPAEAKPARAEAKPAAPPASKAESKPAQEGRAFVVGDADPFTDLLIANRANAIFAIDVLRWLLGEPDVAGLTNSEEDVPVRHTRKQDVVWFYASVFLAPALAVALGLWATRNRRRREVIS